MLEVGYIWRTLKKYEFVFFLFDFNSMYGSEVVEALLFLLASSMEKL